MNRIGGFWYKADFEYTDVEHVAANMRFKTALETLYSGSRSVCASLSHSCIISDKVWMGMYNQIPFGFVGVVNIGGGCGLAWFLATDLIDYHKIAFAKACKRMYYPLLTGLGYSKLGNFVWDTYTEAKDLLYFLGFKDTDIVVDQNGQPFRWLEWEIENV